MVFKVSATPAKIFGIILGLLVDLGRCRLYVQIGVRRPSPRSSLLTRGSGEEGSNSAASRETFREAEEERERERWKERVERRRRRRRRYRLANILDILTVRRPDAWNV